MWKRLAITLVFFLGFSSPSFGGIAHKAEFRWKSGAVIRVRFLDGDDSDKAIVLESARKWERSGANIKFREVKTGFAEVRISFDKKLGCWSYYGRMALSTPQNQATMNLGFLKTDNKPYMELATLHEFGHMLGLIHEHQNIDLPFRWDLAKTYNFFQEKPFYWSQEKIVLNVVGVFRKEDVDYSEFDQDSIMFYPIPKICIVSGTIKDTLNHDLSIGDKRFISRLYPQTKKNPSHVSFLGLAWMILLGGFYSSGNSK